MTTQLSLYRKATRRDGSTMMPVMLIDIGRKAVRSTLRCSDCSGSPGAREDVDERRDRHHSIVGEVL